MDESEDYLEKSGQIRQLASLPPEQLSSHLADSHNTLDAVAPNISPHVYSAATNAVQFLNSKLPGSGNEFLQDNPLIPSQTQQQHWLNLHATVNNPLSVLEHVKNSTLNSQHLEALQTVYPDLHADMIQKTIEELGSLKAKKETLPYARRIAISKFIGQPLDSTMTPQGMQAIIKSAGPNTGPAAQRSEESPKRPTEGTLREIDQANKLYETSGQARSIQKRK